MDNRSCIYLFYKYIRKKEKKLEKLERYTESLEDSIWSTFNHLSVYFPEAYQHMLEVWGVANEDC